MLSSTDEDDLAKQTDLSNLASLRSRAYQLEMLEHSLQRNIIVSMSTGSGKTQVAKLRIEVELQRTPNKYVWMTVPSVALAQQQYAFLASCLPMYRFRLLTGLDHLHLWKSPDIWNAVLENINAIVSTPQVLLDALTHGFISLQRLSLLVLDECHHTTGNAPTNTIMREFFHPLKHEASSQVPHILGLTASPIMRDELQGMEQLERNLNAICKAPTRNLPEYSMFVHKPVIEKLRYDATDSELSPLLRELSAIVKNLNIHDVPSVRELASDTSVQAKAKYQEILKKESTKATRQIRSLLGRSITVKNDVGVWAADLFVKTCLEKLGEVLGSDDWLTTVSQEDKEFIFKKLQSLRNIPSHSSLLLGAVAGKANTLIQFLEDEYYPSIAAVVFVKQRSVAWALTQLFVKDARVAKYEVFAMVGAANLLRQNLTDLADMTVQDDSLAAFRMGNKHLCIATSVMEEGIDIPAMNLVVRFDEPETFRSFVQSRGRARQARSKYVLMLEAGCTEQKLEEWVELEKEVERKYMDDLRTLREADLVSEEFDNQDLIYRVPSTGAVLTMENARQHLEHFCTSLPKSASAIQSRPCFIPSGSPTLGFSAKVVLPSWLHVNLQVMYSSKVWESEKSAIKESAFQAMKSLHESGLLNNHLLPFPRFKGQTQAFEQCESTYDIVPELDVWKTLMALIESPANRDRHKLRSHLLQVSGGSLHFSSIYLHMPLQFQSPIQFRLCISAHEHVSVRITAATAQLTSPDVTNAAKGITEELLTMILGRRLKHASWGKHLPYLITPADGDLVDWLHTIRSTSKINADTFTFCECLVKKENEHIPYVLDCRKHHPPSKSNDPKTIQATKLSRRLNYLTIPPRSESPVSGLLNVEECVVLGLPVACAQTTLLIPSIMHVVELHLRSQIACNSVLKEIGFKDLSLVATALTTASASDQMFYERLEYLGDTILKFNSFLQCFVDFPLLPEGALTWHHGKIVNNARLRRATCEAGLEIFISRHPFAGGDWTYPFSAEQTGEEGSKREAVSSKLLADVAEALLGAAWLDGGDKKVSQTLKLLLPEVDWKLPQTNVVHHMSTRLNDVLVKNTDRLQDVENMIGYAFRHKELLAEALTASSSIPGITSLDRLEFLGDAIIDRTINQKLFDSSLGLTPAQMTFRHHALVNEYIFSFLAFELQHTILVKKANTNARTGEIMISEEPKIKTLNDYVRRAEADENLRQQDTFSRYLAMRSTIRDGLIDSQVFPWLELCSINASKSTSDVIESITAAIYLDSGGDLNTCERFLRTLGLMDIVEHIANKGNIECRPPQVILREKYVDIKIETVRSSESRFVNTESSDMKEKAYMCEVRLNREVVAKAHGISRSEAEMRAAEAGLTALDWKANGENVIVQDVVMES